LGQVTTIKKGELTEPPITYPSIYKLVRDCSMKPSNNHQYQVMDLVLDNIIVCVLSPQELYLSPNDVENLSSINSLYHKMVHDVMRLKGMDFLKLREPRIGYAKQEKIQQCRVDMATVAMIHYFLHPGMLIQYVKGEYVGENRDVSQVLNDVLPYVDDVDAKHIERILMQGCPLQSNFKETLDMKMTIIKKGNQTTFKMYLETATRTMNKEDRHSHVLSVKLWVLYCSMQCQAMVQGMQVKPGKNPRIIFDPSTKSDPHEVVLNEITTTEFEANIDFGQAKMKLLTRIYNWRVANPSGKIYLALTDITACFQFPRIHADVTRAFGFVAENLSFLETSMVFGSNTSASCWKQFRRAIEKLIPVYSVRKDLVLKHKKLLDMLTWDLVDSVDGAELVQAI
jgi:hypothetical protein